MVCNLGKILINKITVSTALGLAAGLVIASNMDRRSRKKIRTVSRKVKNSFDDLCCKINEHNK